MVPVRDNAAHSTTKDVHATTVKMSSLQPGTGHVSEDAQSGGDGSAVKTVQYLLGQLKALITGQGSVAEKLLCDLEQTVLLPAMNAETSNIQIEPDSSLRSQNTELRRRVRILNQQLKENAERQQNTSEAQQELQDDLTELREALGDTRRRLSDREAKNALVESELDAARSRLLDSERQRSELVSVAQQRLEEIGHLKRALRTSMVADRSVSDSGRQHRTLSPERPADRVSRYLLSLVQREPVHAGRSRAAAGKGGDARLQNEPEESACSEWSAGSGSTFDTRDEAAFRDGLSALDASIASLQRTIKMDLVR
ncbi:coiled-coil domain-containing protein 14-like [Brachionichthys hirsutus]|uniref:coiled-coil domain-containing protein 14-like n=1 Tax=Brachionichthys hirsutus TaxID=412623 RepID=UPI0036051114